MILLDSHIVLWLAESAHRISARARAAIDAERRSGRGLAISDITLAELATAYSNRRFSLAIPLETFLEETESRFTILPITSRIAARATALPKSYPRDLGDRLIGATAVIHGLKLVTADRLIRKAKAVPVIW